MGDLKVRYVVFDDWPDAFEALKSNQAVLAPNLGITDERLHLFDFTVPYETFRISIFVRSATVDINKESDLIGKKVGVVEKNQGLVLMREQGGSDLQVFDSVEEAFMALLSGRVDALVYPEQVITAIATRSGLEDKIKTAGKPLQEIKRAIAVRKGEPELFQKLDNAIRKLIKTPEYKMIYEKWYGKPNPFWNVTRAIMVMGIILGLAIAGMLAWRYVSILKLNNSLSEAKERFRAIVENANAGYFFIDKEGTFQSVNNAWLEMHGYDSPDDVIGKPFTLTQVDADLEAAQKVVETLLAGHPIPAGEFTRRCKDGSVGYHTFSSHPVVHGAQVIGLEGFFIDTNELKRTEEEKRKLEARLWQAKKAESLGRMAGAIAHHFNNQLSVVLGNLELALDDAAVDAVTREFLIEAMKAARRSSEVSGLMLTYLGQSTGIREPLDLSEVCLHHLPLLQDILQKGIDLETDFMASGPVVAVNTNQVQQVLNHLVANGAEAIGDSKGRVTLTTKTVSASDIPKINIAPVDWEPGTDILACLEVTDTGCGITDQDMEKIFDPFFTTKFTGRGIGLAVVLGIVKVWNGAINIESSMENGSTFRVFLPLVTDDISRRSEKASAVYRKDSDTVLLVEDEEQVRKMGATMLKRLGFSVLAVADGTEALEMFRQHQGMIRCVITDLSMPGMDDWETIAALRKVEPDLPVILASGYHEAQAMGRDDAEQPNAFLHKPYSKDELKNALSGVLRDKIEVVT